MSSCFNIFLLGEVQLGSWGKIFPNVKMLFFLPFFFLDGAHCLMGEGLFSDTGRTKRNTLLERQLVGLTPVQRWDLRVSAEM